MNLYVIDLRRAPVRRDNETTAPGDETSSARWPFAIGPVAVIVATAWRATRVGWPFL